MSPTSTNLFYWAMIPTIEVESQVRQVSVRAIMPTLKDECHYQQCHPFRKQLEIVPDIHLNTHPYIYEIGYTAGH